MEVLAVLELPVLFAEEPSEHLPSLHAGANYAPGLVPVLAVFPRAAAPGLVLQLTLADLQANLTEDSHQEVVDIVVDAHRDLGEFRAIGARQALAV